MAPAKLLSSGLGWLPAHAYKAQLGLAIVLTLATAKRIFSRESLDVWEACGPILVAMTLSSPVLWYHHLVFFLPAIVTMLARGSLPLRLLTLLSGVLAGGLYS
jgi:hypothetical protein